jgi:hypothetical protein
VRVLVPERHYGQKFGGILKLEDSEDDMAQILADA